MTIKKKQKSAAKAKVKSKAKPKAKPKPPLISMLAYAKLKSVSRQYISQLKSEGKLTLINSKVDPAKADAELKRNGVVIGAGDPAGDKTRKDFNDSRTMRENYKAKLAKLEYEEKAGDVVSVETVRRDAFTAARITRDAILSIPDRIAAQLASTTDETEVHQMLESELLTALEKLANENA